MTEILPIRHESQINQSVIINGIVFIQSNIGYLSGLVYHCRWRDVKYGPLLGYKGLSARVIFIRSQLLLIILRLAFCGGMSSILDNKLKYSKNTHVCSTFCPALFSFVSSYMGIKSSAFRWYTDYWAVPWKYKKVYFRK